MSLKGYQRKYLRSLAHHLTPTVFIGKNDLSSGVFNSINDAFSKKELIKIKIHKKEKENYLIEEIVKVNKCDVVGSIGRMLIAYKQNADPELRKIKLPKK